MGSLDSQSNNKWLSPGSGSSVSSGVKPESRSMRGARRTLDPSTGLYAGEALNRQSSGLERSERLDANLAQAQQSSVGSIPQYPPGLGAQGATTQNITVSPHVASAAYAPSLQWSMDILAARCISPTLSP